MIGILKKHYEKAYTKYKTRRMKKCGEKVIINPRTAFMNADRIEIGSFSHIGSDCVIEAWTCFEGKEYDPYIRIGSHVNINPRCHIGAVNEVIIEDGCLIGRNVLIIDHNHGETQMADMLLPPNKRHLFSKGPVIIHKNCWLCENCVILPGVEIGESSIIGANSVVTKDVPAFSVVCGNPARIVKKIENE